MSEYNPANEIWSSTIWYLMAGNRARCHTADLKKVFDIAEHLKEKCFVRSGYHAGKYDLRSIGPIRVYRPNSYTAATIVDGLHRLMAANLLGCEEIGAIFVDEAEAVASGVPINKRRLNSKGQVVHPSRDADAQDDAE